MRLVLVFGFRFAGMLACTAMATACAAAHAENANRPITTLAGSGVRRVLHASTVALVVMVALVGHTIATAQESQTAKGKAKSPLKELAVDLGQGVELEMLLIPAGEFLMGSPDSDKNARGDEKPQHRVSITQPFYLGKYLVTQQQWQAVMGNNPSEFKGPQNPVDSVGWEDCCDFLKKLNEKFAGSPAEFALPTEAQWEYACRAGSRTKYFLSPPTAQRTAHARHTHFLQPVPRVGVGGETGDIRADEGAVEPQNANERDAQQPRGGA